jgi:hypothetical protein
MYGDKKGAPPATSYLQQIVENPRHQDGPRPRTKSYASSGKLSSSPQEDCTRRLSWTSDVPRLELDTSAASAQGLKGTRTRCPR